MGDDRPSRYEENGIVVYRASALGSCIKSLTALGLGMTPEPHPDWLLAKFQEGIDGEPMVVKMMVRDGWRFRRPADGWWYEWDDGQILVEVPVGEGVIIRGHLDGVGLRHTAPIGEGTRPWTMVEIKCCSEDYSKVVLKKPPLMYEVQVSTYMGVTKLPGILVVGVKDKSGTVVDYDTRDIDVAPMSMARVKARVAEVERRVGCGELGDCDYRQWPCQFPWLCDGSEYRGKKITGDDEVMGVMATSLAEIKARHQEARAK